jgi:hypothetical protein
MGSLECGLMEEDRIHCPIRQPQLYISQVFITLNLVAQSVQNPKNSYDSRRKSDHQPRPLPDPSRASLIDSNSLHDRPYWWRVHSCVKYKLENNLYELMINLNEGDAGKCG